MNLKLLLPSIWLALLIVLTSGTTTPQLRAAPRKAATAASPVTLPRKSPLRDFAGSNVYWEGDLFVAGLPLDGTMAIRPDTIGPEGSLPQKFGWYRRSGLRGEPTIAGRRLDAPAPHGVLSGNSICMDLQGIANRVRWVFNQTS